LETKITATDHFRSKIDAILKTVPKASDPENLYDPIRYLLNLGGKRFRPILTLLSYSLFRDDIDRALRPAVGIEMFHNFTLIHDDIMDGAPLRRGNPTVHEKWGVPTAILSGDVLLVEAYDSILDVDADILKKVLSSFNDCAAKVCEGQQRDMDFENKANVTESEYIEMTRLKTAILLGFSMELGAIIAGAETQDISRLKSAGEAMGIGFQLKDDLLDSFGEQGKFGKQLGGDIVANKKTFLWIKALDVATPAQKAEILRWSGDDISDSEEKVAAVRQIYFDLDVQAHAEQQIRNYFDQSLELVDGLTASNSRKEPLIHFIQQLMGREQ